MRRRKAKKIAILPDPKFNEVVVTKFVNNLMFSGKKSLAFRIFYDAIDMVNEKTDDQEGLDVWKKAAPSSFAAAMISAANFWAMVFSFLFLA